jgi:hypothetical protein
MSDSNSSDTRPVLPGIVMFMCILVFVAAFLAGMQLFAKSPEASGLCFIAAALASGSLARAVLS